MKKLSHVLPLAAVALFGFSLNCGYYASYFTDANYPGLMPLFMALFFISSELVLWSFSNRKNFVSILLKYGLVVFSIFATLSSQFTSTSEGINESAQIVYEKIDNTADINRYEEQIKIQDERISAIFAERREKSYYGLTDNELDFAQSEKARYEKLLSDLKTENKKEVEEIFIVKSIYGWFSDDLPMLVTSGLNEEFIRVIFQLFSSMILAAMSPVCISLIRNIKPEKPHKKPVKTKQPPKPKNTVTEPITAPEPIVEAVPDATMSEIDRKNILKMLLWDFDNSRKIETAEQAEERFVIVHADRPEIKAYSAQECEIVYKDLVGRKTAGMSKNEIIEEIVG